MKWPSSRNRRPKGTVSCTSIAWRPDENFSSCPADRMWNPQSSVSSSINSSCARPCCTKWALLPPSSVILAAAKDRLVFCALRPHRRLQRTKQLLRLVAVVGRQVAHVDVDRHETIFRPGVDREMRFREKDGTRDTLRPEPVPRVA